ncbi:uncharacterized protein fusl [Dermacentor albipictus]|uniref:uncharacterized protein fusl n=1 Tax=Dermacentor albipictus TaxID=60249 RepID=UPI0031FDBA6C
MAPSAGLVVATWDALLSLLVCTPLVVAHWRAVWFLLDWFVLPQRPLVSGWLCCVVGHAFVLLAHLVQHNLGSLGDVVAASRDVKGRQRRQWPWREFAGRLYTPLLSVATIAQWRGIWLLHDLYLVEAGPLPSALVSLVLGSVGLALAGSLKTMAASPPFAFGSDVPWAYFEAPTRLGRRPDREGGWPWFVADCALTVVVLHTLLISGWRGLWALLDELRRSATASLVSGATAGVLLLVAQAPAGILWQRLGGEPKAPENVLNGEAGVSKIMLEGDARPSENGNPKHCHSVCRKTETTRWVGGAQLSLLVYTVQLYHFLLRRASALLKACILFGRRLFGIRMHCWLKSVENVVYPSILNILYLMSNVSNISCE